MVKQEYLELFQKLYDVTWEYYLNDMRESDWSIDVSQKCSRMERELEEQIISLAKREDAFEIFTSAIEEIDPNLFEILIANLDSKPDDYTTLYDLFKDYNNIHKAKITIPDEATKMIKIKF